MIQEIAVYAIVIFAVGFLIRKFFFTEKSKKDCGKDCGC